MQSHWIDEKNKLASVVGWSSVDNAAISRRSYPQETIYEQSISGGRVRGSTRDAGPSVASAIDEIPLIPRGGLRPSWARPLRLEPAALTGTGFLTVTRARAGCRWGGSARLRGGKECDPVNAEGDKDVWDEGARAKLTGWTGGILTLHRGVRVAWEWPGTGDERDDGMWLAELGREGEMGIAQFRFTGCEPVCRHGRRQPRAPRWKPIEEGERETANEGARRLPVLKGQAGIIRRSDDVHNSIWDNAGGGGESRVTYNRCTTLCYHDGEWSMREDECHGHRSTPATSAQIAVDKARQGTAVELGCAARETGTGAYECHAKSRGKYLKKINHGGH
ncbi:hypothetical protein BC827DRAFT_1383086 [Russula dissimulans]|nr:hypothetical protein BC827DRAFT_1383086 [Russula dissimulans]